MRYTLPLALLAALGLSACVEVSERATAVGVTQQVQSICLTAAADEIGNLSDPDLDFDAVMERLKVRGKACLIAAAQDILTAQIVKASPAIAGEVIAAPGDLNAVAAVAIAAE